VGLARDGLRVAGLGRTESTLEETRDACPAGHFSYEVCDVSDDQAVQHAIHRIQSRLGPVDAMICNAAVYPRVHFLDQTGEEWAKTLLINVAGAANCCRWVLPSMLERNFGRIVILGSLADRRPIPGASAYSASKGALHVIAAGLAAEIDPRRFPNVLVNELLPGAVRTSMSVQGQEPEAVYPWVKRLIDLPEGGPTGRMFNRDREIHPNDSLKQRLVRLLIPALGRN
jgi:NAD(P)-dependent dehydrogenase (short-subunit alcohol dehydrogenase family)